MKIFYGIQGTGNGHITRGRIMAKEFQAANLEVTYQFTGRPQDKFFDMEVFNGYQWRDGLTFSTKNGKLSPVKTVLQSRMQYGKHGLKIPLCKRFKFMSRYKF
jgi:uncharacterized protein (TIGR00661 family)